MTIAPGHRFEATQALRQVLARAVAWGMLDINPAKVGVDNPVRRRKEQHPCESWAERRKRCAPHRTDSDTGQMVVDALTRDGRTVPLLRNDVWQLGD